MTEKLIHCWQALYRGLDRLLRFTDSPAVKRAIAQRVFALGYLALALILTLGGWLRPVLSRDISALYLPLGIFGPIAEPERLLAGQRSIPPDSVGVILAVFVGLSAGIVLFRPRYLAAAAGLLLALGLAANAAVAFNHPALVEMLDYEYEQRQQMARTLNLTDEDVMSIPTNTRVGLRAAPVSNQQRGDLERGWLYLLHGRWLVPWAALGILMGCPGSLSRRVGMLGFWSLLGLVLVGCACGTRLVAEYHWLQAQRLEAQCRFLDAQQAIERAVELTPQLLDLERTWLLIGKIDHQQGRPSRMEQFFRASQTARDKELPRGITFAQDLPWVISGIPDSRSGLAPPPSAFNLAFADGSNRPGVPDYDERLPPPRGAAHLGYLEARDREPREALEMLADLLEKPGRADDPAQFVSSTERPGGLASPDAAGQTEPRSPVHRQAARLWVERGLASYWRPVTFVDSQPWTDRSHRERGLPAAQQAWLRAVALDPARRDCAMYLGIVQGRINPRRPDLVEETFAPALAGLADQVLRAEILNTLGDCYLHANQLNEARLLYARSYDTFCLPKYINFRAQGRLGGL